MKEIKDQIVKVRLTKSEKDKVAAYCERHDISISELLRQALEKCYREEDK